MTSVNPVLDIVRRITQVLIDLPAETPGLDQVLTKLQILLKTEITVVEQQYEYPPFRSELNSALEQIKSARLKGIADAIRNAEHCLNWQIDNGIYYSKNADVGESYLNGNMHCELIGPNYSWIYAEDFKLGLFLLKPETLYKDHNHTAPEFYLNLTGPTSWRINFGEWQEHDSGSTIWNPSLQTHATRVYDKPFLSAYIWVSDVSSICNVVTTEDRTYL